jgi:hypothetical protein
MKRRILLQLSLSLWLSIPALSQGRFFLANDWTDLHVPILLLDPSTDEAFGLVDLLPRRPVIAGEPTYKGKRLSYWFPDLIPGNRPRPGPNSIIEIPGNRPMNYRPGTNGVIELKPRIISQLGPGGAPVINPEPADEDDATAALRSAGAAGVPVLLQYSAPDPMMTRIIVRQAYTVFRRLGLEAEVEQVALLALTNTNSVMRRNALDLLRCPSIQSETPRLIEFVRAGVPEVRTAAMEALNRCRVTEPALLPLYRDGLESGDSSQQMTILRSVKFFGPTAKSLLPVIQPFLEKDNAMSRVAAAGALWAIDRRTNVLPALIRELEHSSNTIVLMDCFRVLGEMGAAAKEAVPVILKTADRLNQDPRFRGPSFLVPQAADALKKIEPGSEEKLPPDPMRRFRGPRPEGMPGVPPGVNPGRPEMPFGCSPTPPNLESTLGLGVSWRLLSMRGVYENGRRTNLSGCSSLGRA